jgi:hypothetical protein
MMGREIGVSAAGVGLRRSAGEATGALVRPLGAFERMYHRYEQKSTMHPALSCFPDFVRHYHVFADGRSTCHPQQVDSYQVRSSTNSQDVVDGQPHSPPGERRAPPAGIRRFPGPGVDSPDASTISIAIYLAEWAALLTSRIETLQ